MALIDGKMLAKTIEQTVAQKVARLKEQGITPELHVVLVGEDKASHSYVNNKAKAALRVGMNFMLHELPETTTEQEMLKTLQTLQENPRLSGLIIQIPLPEHLYTEKVLNAIKPENDIDCLTNINLGRLVMNNPLFTPPTPAATLAIVDSLGIAVKGKNVTVIGTGALVGKPLAIMLVNLGASVTTINSRSTNVVEKCLSADIIITGVGKKNILTAKMVKPGAVVIDTGFVYDNGVVSGDVNFAEVSKIAGHITPTPGGVGPVTIAQLLTNTVLAAEMKK
jgi:methylenetetrahydrofolate dehydrogenase (NADP+)/methenyltetrahydrofolate cyclohydrolase